MPEKTEPAPEAEGIESELPSPPKEWNPDRVRIQALTNQGMGFEPTFIQKPHETLAGFMSRCLEFVREAPYFIDNEGAPLLKGRPAMMGRDDGGAPAAQPQASDDPTEWGLDQWCEAFIAANPDAPKQHFVIDVYGKTYAKGKQPSTAQRQGLESWRKRMPDPRAE